MRPAWRPSLGAVPGPAGTAFRVFAPDHARVEVVVEGGPTAPLARDAAGFHAGVLAGVGAGARYRYRVDGEGPWPDPASRSQPLGVHGPSEVVDPGAFAWTDGAWRGVPLAELVVYELHVGTFTPEGTFAAAAARLDHLAALGITAVELMPLADFAGARGWGYDGVCPFAPARCYGCPDDLRAFVDAAHRRGLAVLVDVVLNHLGPDGNQTGRYAAAYRDPDHQTPWGDAIGFGRPGAAGVRELFLGAALHWLGEYHADGLRLDATHAVVDGSPRHVLAELADAAHRLWPRALVIAEDDRNEARLLRGEAEGGLGLDAVWADDLHHQLHRRLTGERDGYYVDFTGTAADVAATLRQGWFYTGQRSGHRGGPRGTSPAGLAPERFVVCLQNHDQVGNRALGDRLHAGADPAAWRAALALVLLAPQTPLLFMGQEWAASTPFRYFTDHEPALGRLVTEGRRREFAGFDAFRDPAARARIPDPQAAATFEASRLRWDERELPGHAAALSLHRALLRARREVVLPRRARWVARAAGPDAVVLEGPGAALVARLEGAGAVEVAWPQGGAARVVLDTEGAGFAAPPAPAALAAGPGALTVRFTRPGAVLIEAAGA